MEKLAYSVAELRDKSGLGTTTIFGLLRDRRLVRFKVGRRTLITAESVAAFFGSNAETE